MWGLYEFFNSNALVGVDPTGEIWGWIMACLNSKDLYTCATMRRYWNDFQKQCEDESEDIDSFDWMLMGRTNCPEQLYPVVAVGSMKHADLCCMFKKASDEGLDLEKFGNSASACIRGMRLPFNVGGIVINKIAKVVK
jgi:hypothetical protein